MKRTRKRTVKSTAPAKRDPRLRYSEDDGGKLSIGAAFRLIDKDGESMAVAMFCILFDPDGGYPDVPRPTRLIAALKKQGEAMAASLDCLLVSISLDEYDREYAENDKPPATIT